jgi:hypothetical protein
MNYKSSKKLATNVSPFTILSNIIAAKISGFLKYNLTLFNCSKIEDKDNQSLLENLLFQWGQAKDRCKTDIALFYIAGQNKSDIQTHIDNENPVVSRGCIEHVISKTQMMKDGGNTILALIYQIQLYRSVHWKGEGLLNGPLLCYD